MLIKKGPGPHRRSGNHKRKFPGLVQGNVGELFLDKLASTEVSNKKGGPVALDAFKDAGRFGNRGKMGHKGIKPDILDPKGPGRNLSIIQGAPLVIPGVQFLFEMIHKIGNGLVYPAGKLFD
jgi:hypothetical protein